jgi:2-keto-4-pentenoate hydratase/2-oxohepta-3-ene-1,7-dioic acid hydratase in catechol pathway
MVASGETVEITPEVEAVGVGPELTAVVGEELWRPDAAEAADAIAGFTVSNDVSAGGRWPGNPSETVLSRGYKMLPTFRPVLTEAVEITVEEASDLRIEAFVDGEQVADASTAGTRWSIGEMVREVATVMPLSPGDLVALGEPHCEGRIEDQGEVTCRIEGIGELTNPIERV